MENRISQSNILTNHPFEQPSPLGTASLEQPTPAKHLVRATLPHDASNFSIDGAHQAGLVDVRGDAHEAAARRHGPTNEHGVAEDGAQLVGACFRQGVGGRRVGRRMHGNGPHHELVKRALRRLEGAVLRTLRPAMHQLLHSTHVAPARWLPQDVCVCVCAKAGVQVGERVRTSGA